MFHSLLVGLLLGWGACIPLGPMNIEIIRRHLIHGFRFGLAFGLGAVFSDLTYFILVYVGLIEFLKDRSVMHWLGYFSMLALLYFAFSAWFSPVKMPEASNQKGQQEKRQSALCHALIGYGYTLLNPYMIIFWVAVAAQLAALRDASLGGEIPLGLGVVLSTASWVLGLNFLLHRIKRHLSPQWMQRINYAGALCLFAFVVVVGYQLWVKSAF